jgi:hypothetical protein
MVVSLVTNYGWNEDADYEKSLWIILGRDSSEVKLGVKAVAHPAFAVAYPQRCDLVRKRSEPVLGIAREPWANRKLLRARSPVRGNGWHGAHCSLSSDGRENAKKV